MQDCEHCLLLVRPKYAQVTKSCCFLSGPRVHGNILNPNLYLESKATPLPPTQTPIPTPPVLLLLPDQYLQD